MEPASYQVAGGFTASALPTSLHVYLLRDSVCPFVWQIIAAPRILRSLIPFPE